MSTKHIGTATQLAKIVLNDGNHHQHTVVAVSLSRFPALKYERATFWVRERTEENPEPEIFYISVFSDNIIGDVAKENIHNLSLLSKEIDNIIGICRSYLLVSSTPSVELNHFTFKVILLCYFSKYTIFFGL